ncbi:MAG: CaiB/BaiF CoA transferase family protein, partial [Alphaproteobacteria bacterium]
MTETEMTPSQRLPALPLGGGFDLLAGVRVLDLTTSIAGPYCTLLLGDMGAEVVKIERPGQGDDCRAWGPPFIDGESVWFQSVNRNKQSVTLDYSQPAGLAILHELVAKSDIVVTNAVPRVQEKLKADYDTCKAIRPDIVFVSISGFGLTGARKDWPGYDLIAEGYSGVMDMTGEIENDPQKVGTPAADLLTGMDGAYAAVAALFDRMRTGRGHKLDLSLVESMTRFMTPIIAPHLATGDVPRRSGAKESVIAVYQVFHTADDPLTLGLGNDNLFKRFCNAVGRPDMADSPDYAN